MKEMYRKFCKLEELLALILLAGITILVFISAIMRSLKMPLNWAQDVALVAFAWMIFFGSDIAIRGAGLIGVDLFVRKLPMQLQRLIDLLFKLIIIVFLGVLVFYGFQMTVSSWARQITTLHISYGWVYLSVPIGAILMIISTVTRMVDVFQKPMEEKKEEK